MAGGILRRRVFGNGGLVWDGIGWIGCDVGVYQLLIINDNTSLRTSVNIARHVHLYTSEEHTDLITRGVIAITIIINVYLLI